MNALDAYKRRSGRMFPTCSEILEVIRELGYRRVQDMPADAEMQAAEPLAQQVASEATAEPTA